MIHHSITLALIFTKVEDFLVVSNILGRQNLTSFCGADGKVEPKNFPE